jgi:hypothetical protein
MKKKKEKEVAFSFGWLNQPKLEVGAIRPGLEPPSFRLS